MIDRQIRVDQNHNQIISNYPIISSLILIVYPLMLLAGLYVGTILFYIKVPIMMPIKSQQINISEHGDWADVELYEVYQNKTTDSAKIPLIECK